MAEDRQPDHDKDDHTPRELSRPAHMNRHLLLRHHQGGISDVWGLPDLLALHAKLHLGYAPVLTDGSKSAYLDAIDHDRGAGG